MLKSFLNYPGGKYRLLKQILPLFPDSYTQFVDLFSGSAVVSVNALLDVPTHAYDNNEKLIELLNFVKIKPVDEIITGVEKIINDFGLSNTARNGYAIYESDSTTGLSKVNKMAYMKLRESYNIDHDVLKLYVLIVFGFNNQIRFNRKGDFNNPVGKRDFNSHMAQKLEAFSNRVKNMDIDFIATDFRSVSTNMYDSFYYVDPPYLVTNAVYNENGGWSEQDEQDLLEILDSINDAGNKFALSNVLSSKGRNNNILIEWANNYNVYYLDVNYANSNYQTSDKGGSVEVLITNFNK